MNVTGHAMVWSAGRWWSGGAYGLEASILTSVVLVALFAYVYKAPVRRQKLAANGPASECSMRTAATVAVLIFLPAAGFTADKLTWQDRVEIDRGMIAEYAKVKVLLPRSKKPSGVQCRRHLGQECLGRHRQSEWTRRLQWRHGADHQSGD